MSSILSHLKEWKNLIFSENFTFSDFRPGCNKFYSGPGRTSLHRDWPLPKSPLPPGGKKGNSPTPSGQNTAISRKVSIFRLPTEGNMCSSALFPSRLPPLKAPLSTGRSWVQFLVMTEWKNPIFSENFIFSDLRTGCNRVYSGPGRVDPLRRPPCSLGGETGFPHLFHG